MGRETFLVGLDPSGRETMYMGRGPIFGGGREIIILCKRTPFSTCEPLLVQKDDKHAIYLFIYVFLFSTLLF